MSDTDTWFDRDHNAYEARDTDTGLCEKCEADVPAVVEIRTWPLDGESGSGPALCEACYTRLRADSYHNPPGARADEYVSLGAAL